MEFQSSGDLTNLPSAAVSKTSFYVQHWVTSNSLVQVALSEAVWQARNLSHIAFC